MTNPRGLTPGQKTAFKAEAAAIKAEYEATPKDTHEKFIAASDVFCKKLDELSRQAIAAGAVPKSQR